MFRTTDGLAEILAFRHPSAGKQLVKGSIEEGEAPAAAALRELEEESGISAVTSLRDLGEAPIGSSVWHFFAVDAEALLEGWTHQTKDDFGHVFSFFWHRLADDLDGEWHPQFHQALEFIRRAVPTGSASSSLG